jgi:hypothetical protein
VNAAATRSDGACPVPISATAVNTPDPDSVFNRSDTTGDGTPWLDEILGSSERSCF